MWIDGTNGNFKSFIIDLRLGYQWFTGAKDKPLFWNAKEVTVSRFQSFKSFELVFSVQKDNQMDQTSVCTRILLIL